jgi:hypothetical protein
MMTDDYHDETALLEELNHSGWALFAVGERGHAPELLVAVKRWQFVSDVIALRGQERVTAYRTPDADPLRATFVLWHYAGHAAYAVNQVLQLSGEFGEPYPIPDECRIPELDNQPFVMRPPQHLQPDAYLPSADGRPW